MVYLAAKITFFLEKQGKITKLFGYLAQFRLVIWRIFVWLFGANPNDNTGTIIISQEDFIKFLEAMGNSYEFVELYD
jgi:hypothetical protein